MKKIIFKNLKTNKKLSNKKINLFQKIKIKKEIEKIKTEFEFSDLNLIVGKIIEIKKHKDAEKLFIEKIDIGEEKPIQIISGLVNYYNENDLLNKNVIILNNLKSAKIRGEISNGMILCVENKKEKSVKILTTKNLRIGENLKIEKNLQIANSKNEISIKEFFKIKNFKSKKNGIFFNDKKIEKIYCHKDLFGNIC